MKTNYRLLIVMAIAMIIFSSCVDVYQHVEFFESKIKVETVTVDSVTATNAIAVGIITSGGTTETIKGFCWCEDSNKVELPTINDKFIRITEPGDEFKATLDLEPGKMYLIRAFAINEDGVSYGNAIKIRTIGGEPGIGNCSIISDVLSATVKVSVYNNYLPTKIIMRYGLSKNYSETIMIAENVLEPSDFEIKINGLKQSTSYFYQIKVVNSNGEEYRQGIFVTGHGL